MIRVIVVSLVLLFLLTHSFAQNKLNVVVSFYPIYDFTKNIGGEKINIITLIPFGVEPHDWEPTPKDISKILNADLFIYNGAGLEPWAERLLKDAKNKNLITIDMYKSISAKGDDPHIWLDPVLVKSQLRVIRDALIKLDPKNRLYYEVNYKSYLKKVETLDKEIKDTLSRCKKRVFVTSHNAFSRFASRYGLIQIPVTGISPEAEPNPRDLVEVTKIIKENKIGYIFTEPLISPKLAESISRETGVKILLLDPIEGLSKDDVKAGKDYLSKMRENLGNLKLALGYE
ncbi:MAG: metal ABC transporter substrate-binding protein [bacterium]|nr:metal ABC transporter substrate-binding protein [bacterium]